MKTLLALAVIAAFASGLIGAWAIGRLTEQAGAAPPCDNPNPPTPCTPTPTTSPTPTSAPTPTPQAREDQISLFGSPPGLGAGENVTPGQGYLAVGNGITLRLDPNDYPSSSVFRWEGQYTAPEGANLCWPLFGFDASSAGVVPGSELCLNGSPEALHRSDTFGLPDGERQYLIVRKCDLVTALECHYSVQASRIIAEWTE
jgi:hypothetical protein